MRVGIYTSPKTLLDEESSTRYLHESLRDEFNVALYHQRDVTLCREDDVVFCRFPRPLDLGFISELEPYRDKLIINDPVAQLRWQSKRTLLLFPDLVPPTAIFDSPSEVVAWAGQFETVVLKPVDGHKGRGIVRLAVQGASDAALEREARDMISAHGTVVAQRYIDGVEELGDKRINVFGFEPISALLRHPKPGSFICNMASGGSCEAAEITDADQRILDRVIPFLWEHGVWWAGIDVIGPYLSEVNIATPCTIQVTDVAHGDRRGAEAFVARLKEFESRRERRPTDLPQIEP